MKKIIASFLLVALQSTTHFSSAQLQFTPPEVDILDEPNRFVKDLVGFVTKSPKVKI